MGKIAQLPEDVAIKIAAGEVVERPASVVKELVENALDAAASQIDVTIKDGGKTLIEIKDNGSGMDRDDAVKAFLRHGTSKIHSVEDLAHVISLGFRGEALAAIGASADVELVTTETTAQEGTKVRVLFGRVEPAKPHAPLPGTTIKVQNLFEALPVRQKFLKSDATEWKATLDILIKQMLAHPEVGFTIHHNTRQVYTFSPNQDFADRVAALWQVDPKKLIPVQSEVPHLAIAGVVVKPEMAHEGKGRQFLAVNGHPVTDKMVQRSARDAYGTLLPPALLPSYALNLTIHPGMVDVNIHPRKDEVRFVNPQEIYRFVFQSVSQALSSVDLAFQEVPVALTSSPFVTQSPETRDTQPLNRPAPFRSPTVISPQRHATFDYAPSQTLAVSPLAEDTPVAPILTLDCCYLVTTHDNNLVIIDQHAAHERILYHQLWQIHEGKNRLTQPLLVPIAVTLSEPERALLEAHGDHFQALGFGITLSEDTIQLTEVPQVLHLKDPETFLTQVLSTLKDDQVMPSTQEWHHKIFATMACKAAIKAGDEVSEAEKQRLVRELLALPDRFTCPHGRPSHIVLGPNQMEKLFKRTGF